MASNAIRFTAYFDDQVSNKLTGLRGQFDALAGSKGFGAVMLGVGAGVGMAALNAAVTAVGQLGEAFRSTIEAASEEETTQARLRAALDANVPAWGANIEAIEKRMQAGRRLAFDDEEMRQSLGSLVAALHDVDRAFEVQAIAMDLARFKGISLQEATDALVKVQARQYRGLKSLGIELDRNATAQEAFAAVQRVTAGQAQAYTETFAGAQTKLQVAVEEVQEAIGSDLLPMLTELATVLADEVIPGIGEFYQGLKDVSAWMNDPGGDWKGVDQLEAVAEFLGKDIDVTNYETAMEDVAAATAEMARDVVSYSEEAMIGMATEVKGGSQTVAFSVERILREGAKKAQEQAKAYRAAGTTAIKAIADGIRSARSEIDAALDQLAIDLKNAMTKDAEIGRLGGLLTGEMVAEGLAAGDESVNASAQYVVSVIEARLDELTNGAYSRGKKAALALAAGFAQSLPANLRSELPDVVAAAREYEKIKNTFARPAADGARLLAGSLDAVAKSGSAAASSLADLKKEAADALKTAKTELAGAASQLALFAAASVPVGQFVQRFMSVAEAAARVDTVLGRVQRSIANFRAGSSSSLAAVASAFGRLKSVAADYFDAVHRANLRQIDDARMAAMAQYDAQIGAINAEVEAYRAQLEEKRTARQEEQLKEALASAETPEDVKRATEALNDFYDDQHLRQLENQARAQIDRLELAKDGANKLYDQQTEAENARYEQQKAAFEALITLATTSLDSLKGVWGTKQQEILALLRSYVGPFGAAGQALIDAFTAGIGGAAPAASGPYAGAIASLDKYIANLEAIAKPTAKQQGQLADYIARRAEYAARASGGPVLPEGTYLVGERGPEYLHMGNQSGWVEPGAGGQPVVIQVQVDGRTLAEVVDKRLFFKYRLGAT